MNIVRGLRTSAVFAGVAALALVMSGCGSKSNGGGGGGTTHRPSPSRPFPASRLAVGRRRRVEHAATKAINACMVLDTGGVDDKSFNQSSYAGMTAGRQGELEHQDLLCPSNSGNDYTPNLNNERARIATRSSPSAV